MTIATDATAGRDHLTKGRAAAAIKGTLWSLVSSFVPGVLGFLVFLASSRVLSPTEFGMVAFAVSIASVGVALAPAGFREALIQRQQITAAHLNTVFWLCLGAALVIYAILCVAGPFIGSASGQPLLAGLIALVGARIIFDMAAAVPNALIVRTMSFKMLALRTTIASVVTALVCLGLLWAGFGLWALAFSQLAGSIAACIGAMVGARWLPQFQFDRSALRDLRAFGLFSNGNHFITTINIDQLLIGVLMGPAWLGIYSFARRIFQILTDLIAGALNLVSYSLLSSMQNEPKKLREAYLLGTFASSVVAFPVFSGLALVAADLIPFAFGPSWVAAVPVVQAFCVLGLLTAVGILQSSLIRSQGHANLWFYYILGKQVATVLYIFLFASWGVVALTTSLVILNVLLWLPTLHMVVKLLGISIWTYLRSFALPVLATLAMGLCGWLVQHELAAAEPLLRLATTIGAAALSYGAVIVVLGRKQLATLVGFVRKRR